MITVACVRTGTKYPVSYVLKLASMVARHLDRPHRFVCLTDRPGDLVGVEAVDVFPTGLRGWWAKMALFELASRSPDRVLYLDLDMVVCGSLDPLAALDVEFGVCANFTRASGNLKWPCLYGSCAMTFAPGFGAAVWSQFMLDRDALIQKAGSYGDQMVIEWLHPTATLLQEVLPPGFFVGYRDLTNVKPLDCSVLVFAGSRKPHDCEVAWVKEAWT